MTVSDIIRDIYSVSAIGLWGVLAGILVRYGKPALALGVDLVAALTRMSDSMKTSAADSTTAREATARIESACERIEHDVREVRVLLAGRATLVSVPEAPDSEPHPRRKAR